MALVQTITVDPTKVPSDQGSDLSSAGIPLFYDLSNAGSDFWDTVANGGGDIRVFENDGVTELPREVVSCASYLEFDGIDDGVDLDSEVSLAIGDVIEVWTFGFRGPISEFRALLYGDTGTPFQLGVRSDSGQSVFVRQGGSLEIDGVSATSDSTTFPQDGKTHKVSTVVSAVSTLKHIGIKNDGTWTFNGGISQVKITRGGSVLHNWDSKNVSGITLADTGTGAVDGTITGAVFNQTGELHFLADHVDSVSPTNFKIMADGVSADYASDAAFGSEAVWVDEHRVLHLQESTGSTFVDSAGNGDSTNLTGSLPNLGADGQIFNGGSSGADIAPASLSGWGNGFSIRAVVTPGPWSGRRNIVSADGDTRALQFKLNNGVLTVNRWNSSGSYLEGYEASNDIRGVETYVALTAGVGDVSRVYENGVNTASGSASSASQANDHLTLGHIERSGGAEYFGGAIRSVRISKNQLSPDTVTFEYNNQSDNASFFTSANPGGGGGTTVSAADLSQSQTIDGVTLTQGNVLAVDSMSHGQTIDNATLTQANSLDVDGVTQSQTIDAATLTQANAIVPNSMTQGQSLDSATLTQAHVLVPQGMTQGQSVDGVGLTQANVLAANSVSQGQSIVNASLTVAGTLAIDSISQAQTIDQALLTVAGVLTVDGVTQAQTLDALELVQRHVLSVNGITQSQSVDGATLDSVDLLTLDSLAQSQGVDATSLTQYHVLAVDSLTQAQAIDVCLFGGLVIGELNGQIVVYAAMGGSVYAIPALSGTIH